MIYVYLLRCSIEKSRKVVGMFSSALRFRYINHSERVTQPLAVCHGFSLQVNCSRMVSISYALGTRLQYRGKKFKLGGKKFQEVTAAPR